MKHLSAASVLASLPLWSAAHDGHGLQGVHWHATDSVGFMVLAVLAAAALWFGRRK